MNYEHSYLFIYLFMNYEQLKPNTYSQEYTSNMSIESPQSIFSSCHNYTKTPVLAQRITKKWEFWGKDQVSVK